MKTSNMNDIYQTILAKMSDEHMSN